MRFSFFDKLNICTVSVPFLLGNRASSVIYTADPTMMSKKSKNWVLSAFLLHPKSTPAFSTVWFSPWRIWHPGGLSLQQWIWSPDGLSLQLRIWHPDGLSLQLRIWSPDGLSLQLRIWHPDGLSLQQRIRQPNGLCLTSAEDLVVRWPLTAAEDPVARWPLTAAEDLVARWPLTTAEDPVARWPLTAAVTHRRSLCTEHSPNPFVQCYMPLFTHTLSTLHASAAYTVHTP